MDAKLFQQKRQTQNTTLLSVLITLYRVISSKTILFLNCLLRVQEKAGEIFRGLYHYAIFFTSVG
jgi:hypothetical protein